VNWTAFYFLPFLILPILIHLIGKKPEKEIKFPPFELLKRVYREYKWYLKVRNLLLLLVRMSILLLFIISASKLSCGISPEKKEGVGIVIDSSYSTMTFDGNKRIFKKEVEIAKEILMKTKDAKVFKCSDTLTSVFIDDLLNEKIEPEFKSGNARRCYEAISRMGFSEIFWITDGRKEGYEGLSFKEGMKIIDASQGKKFVNAWIDGVEIKEGAVAIHLKSNGKTAVEWEIKSNISNLKGKTEFAGEALINVLFHSDSDWLAIKIKGDSLDADNYYFAGRSKSLKKSLGIFNFSPSEVPHLDEAYYLKKALATGEGFRIKEKVPSTMKGDLKDEYTFSFLLNPLWNSYVKELVNFFLNMKIPIFISAGENPGFKEICELLGIKIRGIKEVESFRKLLPNFEIPFFSLYGEVFDEIYVKKLYLVEPSKEVEPVILLSSGEPILFKIPAKNVYILTTTADLDWSQFPIARIFTPLMIDIVLHSLKDDVKEIKGVFSEKGGKTIVKADMEFSAVPGVYEKDEKIIVANLNPTEESLLTPMSSVKLETEASKRYTGFQVWKYTLLFTGIFLLLESMLLK
jgi:hypothetical protein